MDAQDFEDGTALHNAAFNGHLTIIKALLANQVKNNKNNKNNKHKYK